MKNISLKKTLERQLSPLIGTLLQLFLFIQQQYPEEMKDFLLSDRQLAKELQFFMKRLGGQSSHNYAIYMEGEEKLRGIVEASQSKIEKRINLSQPILFEKDNNLLLEFIPRVLEIETGYSGVTTATTNLSMHRTEAISKIESIGFKKMRENISMIKRL